MNPNYFFDLNYHSPNLYNLYECSKQDSTNSIDYSAFYHESMLDAGLLDAEGMQWVERYQTVSRFDSQYRPIGLEFDCNSKVPAFFANLNPADEASRAATVDGIASVLGISSPGLPPIVDGVGFAEVGIFPARGAKFLRLMLRGSPEGLKGFADSHGCVGTDIITTTSHEPYLNTAISFDWDGTAVTNIMYASPNIAQDDEWVTARKYDMMMRIREDYADEDYTVSWVLKMSLMPNPPPDYLKLYCIIRTRPKNL